MSWPSIPRLIPRWLHRHPLALSSVIAWSNRLRRAGRGWLVTTGIAITGAVTLLAMLAVTFDWTRIVMQQLSSHAGWVAVVSGVYAASLMSRRRRSMARARADSWLVGTPLASRRSVSAWLLKVLPLVWRTVLAVVAMLAAGRAAFASVGPALLPAAMIALGALCGGTLGGCLSRNRPQARPASRYVPRRRGVSGIAPSSDALSRWPVAQAIAWGRPENTRLLLGAAIFLVPSGAGLVGAACILAAWTVGSYLVALLLAMPHAAHAASQWLRTTPISFWSFAWPLARRGLVHQLVATLIAMVVVMALGTSMPTALYLGATWMMLVLLVWTISLVEAFRLRAFAAKAVLSSLAALTVEAREHGAGLLIALIVTAVHLRAGANHERA